ncbi:hypothetical protein A2U01_0081541, partial [Trifolium medium]|nr:hypothetical protein [Trifolium medium]
MLFWTGPRAGPNPLLFGIMSQRFCSVQLADNPARIISLAA